MSESKTSGRRVSGAQRRREALRLRIEGRTLQQIGDALGISRQAAGKHLKNAMAQLAEETREESELLRAIHAARIEHAISVLWPKVEAGSLGAIDRLIKLIETHSKLFGLFAPNKTALTDANGTREYRGGGLSALLTSFKTEQ